MRQIFFALIFSATLFGQSNQKSYTSENLRGISVLSKNIAWASGTHGTYLRTTDGGSTWQPNHVPGAEFLDFRDVEAFNADIAYLLAAGPGEQSRIYKTSDAGKTWALQFTNNNPKGFLDCMAFWDRDHGIAVGDPVPDSAGKLHFELLATTDGVHWNPLPNNPEAMEGEGAFAASGTCIAVQGKKKVWFVTGGKTARVFRSKDRGKTWAVADTPIVHGPASAGIFSIAFRDRKHGLIAGGDYKQPDQGGANLAITSNGGRTWKLLSVTPQAYFSAVAYDPSCMGWVATGTTFTLNIKKNTGSKLTDHNLNALSISRDGDVMVVGPKGLIDNLSCVSVE